MMFSRPAVIIAVTYAIFIILLRPIIPVPEKIWGEKQDTSIISGINNGLSSVIQKTIPKPYDALLGSVVFGTNFSPLDPDLKDSYKKVGLAHLLVASGTQVSILIGTCLSISRFIRIPNLFSIVLISILNILFAGMTGFGSSIVRAAIMGQIVLVGKLFDRDPEIYTSLAISALLLMMFDPLIIFDIGFQLTFTATWALVYLCPILEEKSVPSIIALSLSPIIATFPITLYNFNQLSVVALIVNILVIPWVEFLTIAGFASTVLGYVFLPIAEVINSVLLIVLKLLNGIVYTFSGMPIACVYLKQPSFLLFIAYYIILILFAEYLRGSIMIKFNKQNIFIILLALFAVFLWNTAATSNSITRGKLQISVINVGQGDSIFVKSPSGKTMLIDGGAKTRNFDAGKKRVLPFLHREGINKLDVVVLTHPHNDHVGGLPAVLNEMPVGLVIDSGQVTTTKAYMDFLNIIDRKKIRYILGRLGGKIDLGGGVTGEILTPQEPFIEKSALNNNSVVVRLSYGKFSMIFMGDAEQEAEQRILAYGLQRSTIIKVGHHGSRTASSQEFLNVLKSEVAVISVGKKNVYHHPHQSTIERFKDNRVRIYRTDADGTINIYSDGEKYFITPDK